MFLGWYDDTRKKDVREKIEEAVERYIIKYGDNPDLCLVNEADATSFEGLEVRVVSFVRPNHFWIGRAEQAEAAKAA
jgi:hypothetical protein